MDERHREPQPGPRTKFADLTEEMLYRMSLDGWCNEQNGRSEATTGWFARVSISRDELSEVAQAFEEEMAGAGFTDTTALVGHFLLREDDQGFVEVFEYDNEEEVKKAYGVLERQFEAWDSQDDAS